MRLDPAKPLLPYPMRYMRAVLLLGSRTVKRNDRGRQEACTVHRQRSFHGVGDLFDAVEMAALQEMRDRQSPFAFIRLEDNFFR